MQQGAPCMVFSLTELYTSDEKFLNSVFSCKRDFQIHSEKNDNRTCWLVFEMCFQTIFLLIKHYVFCSSLFLIYKAEFLWHFFCCSFVVFFSCLHLNQELRSLYFVLRSFNTWLNCKGRLEIIIRSYMSSCVSLFLEEMNTCAAVENKIPLSWSLQYLYRHLFLLCLLK